MTRPSNLPTASDEDLVDLARQGHHDAFGELHRRYHGHVHGFIRRMVRDHDLAEDLTQETFVKAFAALEEYRRDGLFQSWIRKIANNQALNYWRSERRGLDTVPLEPTPDASSPRRLTAHGLRATLSHTPTPTPVTARALAPALAQAIARLKEHYRLCFILREIEGRSYEDIAEILNMPVGTVGSCLTRARRQLRAELGHRYDALRAASRPPS